MFTPQNLYPKISLIQSVRSMQFQQLQNQFGRAISEDKPVQGFPSYHGSKENTRNANYIFPKITSSRSATIHMKQLNKIGTKVESFTEEKIKEAINIKERQIEELNLKEKAYLNKYDLLQKKLQEAQQVNNDKREQNCRTDLERLCRLIEALGRNRSELRANIIELKKQLKELKDLKI